MSDEENTEDAAPAAQPVPDEFDTVIEVREIDEPRREAVMVVCRYGETSHRTPRPERFMPGAFTKSVNARRDQISFTTEHTTSAEVPSRIKVARPVYWDTSEPNELRATVRFYDNPEGWDAFGKARSGELNGASVGFLPVEDRIADGGIREVVEAKLHHVAMIARNRAAYDAPGVLETRQQKYTAERLAELAKNPWAEELAQTDTWDRIADLHRKLGEL